MPEPSNPKILYRDIKIEYKMWTHHSQTRESRWCLQPPSQSAPNLTTRHSGRTTASSSLKVLLNKVLMTLLCYLFQPGAEFHADLPEPQPENVLRKGTNPEVDHSSLWWQICCGHTWCFTQVDSYSAFFDNTGKEGAGSTGLAEKISGSTEVLIFLKSGLLLRSILFRVGRSSPCPEYLMKPYNAIFFL